ncbi:MAG: hypothetical protein NUW37_16895, partial [Planctomycetes bacterium]|nr:hypothetical protein [Planctomycetota bacterium]
MLLNPDGTVNTLKRLANRCINPDDPALWKTTFEYSSNLETTRIVFPRQHAGDVEDNSVEFTYSDEDNALLGFVADSDPRTQGNLIRVRRFGTVSGAQEILESRMTYTQPFNRLRSSQSPRAIANDPLSYSAANSLAPNRVSEWVSANYYDFDEATYGDLNDDSVTNNSNGNLVRSESPAVGDNVISSPVSYTVTSKFQYTSEGLLSKTIDPVGVESTFDYEFIDYGHGFPENGYLIATHRDPLALNITTSYTRDERGNITSVVSPRGNDDAEPLTGGVTADPDAFRSLFFFNDRDQLFHTQAPTVDHSGLTVKYDSITFFDRNGNVAASVYENIDYNASSEPQPVDYLTAAHPGEPFAATITNPLDFNQIDSAYPMSDWIRSNFEYDNLNLVTRAHRDVEFVPGPLLSVRSESRIYRDHNDNVVRSVRPEGNFSERIFDERNMLYKVVNGASDPSIASEYSFTYNDNGSLVKSTDARGNSGFSFYDGFDRLVTSSDSIGVTGDDPQYDALGIPTYGNYSRFVYNENSSVIFSGSAGYLDIDALTGGNDNIFTQSSREYDELERPFQSAMLALDSTGGVLSNGAQAYDGLNTSTAFFRENSQVDKTVDDFTNETQFRYDSANRLTHTIFENASGADYFVGSPAFLPGWDPAFAGRSYRYFERNAAGQTVKNWTVDHNQRTQSYEKFFSASTFDALGRATDLEDTLENHSYPHYDSRSNVRYFIDREENVSLAEFDHLNRTTRTHKSVVPGLLGVGPNDPPDPIADTKNDDWITQTYKYDLNSNLLVYTTDNGFDTRYGTTTAASGIGDDTDFVNTYDHKDRAPITLHSDNTVSGISLFDENDNPAQFVDQNGSIFTNTYFTRADALRRVDIAPAQNVDLTNGSGAYSYNVESTTTHLDYTYDGLYRKTTLADDQTFVQRRYNTFSINDHETQTVFGVSTKDVYEYYDTIGNMTGSLYPTGYQTNYSYDNLYRAYKVEGDDGSGPQVLSTNQFAGTQKRLSQRDLFGGLREIRTYEKSGCGCYTSGRVTSIITEDLAAIDTGVNPTNPQLVTGFEYGYNKEDQVMFEAQTHDFDFAENSPRGFVYQYDAAYRLTGVASDVLDPENYYTPATQSATFPTSDYGIKKTFDYDEVNNRKSVKTTVWDSNSMAEVDSATEGYNHTNYIDVPDPSGPTPEY